MRNILLLALCLFAFGCAKSEEASAPDTSTGASVPAPEGSNTAAPADSGNGEAGKGLQVNPDYKGP